MSEEAHGTLRHAISGTSVTKHTLGVKTGLWIMHSINMPSLMLSYSTPQIPIFVIND